MARHNEFCQYLLDMLAPLGNVRIRAMFGGYGVYAGDVMFGLVADDVLYLKTDADNRERFEAAGLPPFTYQGRPDRPPIRMSYAQAPPESLEDADLLCDWARDAVAAARRSSKPCSPKKTTRKAAHG